MFPNITGISMITPFCLCDAIITYSIQIVSLENQHPHQH